MGDKLITSLTVLLTGFVVVFVVLLLLIGIIKLYGTIVYNIQNKPKQTKKEKEPDPKADPTEPVALIESDDQTDENELIAVISAAVYSMYEKGSVKIKSIRRSSSKSNAWKNAGLSDNIRPF